MIKQVKYFRRTPRELAEFRKAVTYFKAQGYPEYEAESKAWDIFHVARKGKRINV